MNPFKIFLLLGVFLFTVETGMAQSDKKEQRKIERAEKKRLKKEERARKQEKLVSMVQDQTLVLEATTIFGRYMDRYEVMPNTNFVKIEGDRVTIQTANNFHVGYNGLGGITINGTIRDYLVKTSKDNSSVSVVIQFTSPVMGHSTLNLNLQPGGLSTAMVVDSRGGRATFQGQVFDLEDSRVYEGMSIM